MRARCSAIFGAVYLTVVSVLVGLLGFVPANALASESTLPKSIKDYQRSTWGPEAGAPTRSILSLTEAPDGWLWVGSSSGLFRFDGVRFEPINTESGGAPARAAHALLALDSGALLIGFANGGISIAEGSSIRHYNEPEVLAVGGIIAFGQDAERVPWAAGEHGLLRFADGHWRAVGKEWNYPGGYASSFLLDSTGTLWVATRTEIVRLFKGSSQFERTGLRVNVRAEFLTSPDGRMWYSDMSGIHEIAGGKIPRSCPARSRLSCNVSWFTCGGTFWTLGLEDFLPGARLPPAVIELSAEMPFASTLLEDSLGSVWVGDRAGGVHRFQVPPLKKLTAVPIYMRHMTVDSSGGVWLAVGSENFATPDHLGGLWRLDGTPRRMQTSEIPSAFSVHTDQRGSVWVASRTELWKQSPSGFSKALDLPLAGSGQMVRGIMVDASDSPWVAIQGGGLFRHDGTGWQRNGGVFDLPSMQPTVMFRAPDGALWFGYNNGDLARLAKGETTVWRGGQGPNVGPVFAIEVGLQTVIGGANGLAVLNHGKFQQIRTRDPRAISLVSGIVQTKEGDLWFTGLRGAVQLGAEVVRSALVNPDRILDVEPLGAVDGFPGTPDPAVPSQSIVLGGEGRIWVKGDEGVAWFDPALLRRDRNPPRMVIRSVEAGGDRRAGLQRVSFAPDTRSVRFDYTALGALKPERLRFRYRLQGVDDHWVEADARREAYYTNLGPGQYRFEVTAANEGGVWAEAPAVLELEIPPTFLQSGLFKLLCAMAVLAVLTLAYRLRVRQLTARERDRLEERIQERMEERGRIARELHDTLLQGTQGLILEVAAATKLVPVNAPAHQLLDRALDRADEVMAEGRDRIQDLRASEDLNTELAQALAETAGQLATNHVPGCVVTLDGSPRPLNQRVRVESYRITREAIVNAIRHAQATTIEIQVIYGNESLQVRVRDDGIGLDAAVAGQREKEGHYGVRGMHERAQKLGATLEIWSRPGSGTEVALTIGAAAAYSDSGGFSPSLSGRIGRWWTPGKHSAQGARRS
jgi:signal transduction histidine kinase/ligand-binding sensor domain-containing protein